MISETFTDDFDTQVTVRLLHGHDHVQLLLVFNDQSAPFSYGFTLDDFQQFANVVMQVAARVQAARMTP